MYQKITENVLITVEPVFSREGSKPEEDMFLWAYHVRIENKRESNIHLRRRHWQVLDSLGNVQKVNGTGIVGEQPIIAPGSVYEYASGTILSAPSGIMMGTYEMEVDNQEILVVEVPAFSLDSPYEKISIN